MWYGYNKPIENTALQFHKQSLPKAIKLVRNQRFEEEVIFSCVYLGNTKSECKI